MANAVDSLRSYLASDQDVIAVVGDHVYTAATFQAADRGQASVVVELNSGLRVFFRADSEANYRLLRYALHQAIESLPLGEVMESVRYYVPPFSGRLLVSVNF